MQSAECLQCRIVREARGESTDGLAAETHDHINSAGCEGMAMTSMAAYLSVWTHLYNSMYAAQKPKSKLKFVTLDKKSNMSTLWRQNIISKNLQQRRAGGEGTGYRGDNTSKKKSRGMVRPRSSVFLSESFPGQSTGWGHN